MAKSSKKKGVTKKTTTRKRGTTKIKYESTKEIKVDKVLVDNFVALQKVMVNLSSKFDNLSDQISKLLQLFEISAKSLAKKDFSKEKDDKELKKVLDKLDNISQQAGLIGKGLALIHETKFKGNEIQGSEPTMIPSILQKPPVIPHPMPMRPLPIKQKPSVTQSPQTQFSQKNTEIKGYEESTTPNKKDSRTQEISEENYSRQEIQKRPF